MKEKDLLSVDIECNYIVYNSKKIADKYFACDIYSKPHFLFFVKNFNQNKPEDYDKVNEYCSNMISVG